MFVIYKGGEDETICPKDSQGDGEFGTMAEVDAILDKQPSGEYEVYDTDLAATYKIVWVHQGAGQAAKTTFINELHLGNK